MSKERNHIRPLRALKKEAPELYERYFNGGWDQGGEGLAYSKKARENEGYWRYCLYYHLLNMGKEYRDKVMSGEQSIRFYFKTPSLKTNVGIITELGRLLLIGWYYGPEVEDFTQRTYWDLYNGFIGIEDQGEKIDKKKAQDLVKHIRVNTLYYYNHQEELKPLLA